MSRYHFDITGANADNDWPPCPRVVECSQCKRVMEAPLLEGDKTKRCCIKALKRALQTWLTDEYAPHMNPNILDLAMAGLSLDALMWDMEHGHAPEYLEKHPEALEDRDKYLNKCMIHRLRQQGFQVHVGRDGTIHGLAQAGERDSVTGECEMLELEIEKLQSNRPGDPDYGQDNIEFEDHTQWGLGHGNHFLGDPDHKDWSGPEN